MPPLLARIAGWGERDSHELGGRRLFWPGSVTFVVVVVEVVLIDEALPHLLLLVIHHAGRGGEADEERWCRG